MRSPRVKPRIVKQLPLNSSCNGHAECARECNQTSSGCGVLTGHTSRARSSGGCHERFPHCSPLTIPEAHLPFARFRSISSTLRRGLSVFCSRACARGGALALGSARGIPRASFSKRILFIKPTAMFFFLQRFIRGKINNVDAVERGFP